MRRIVLSGLFSLSNMLLLAQGNYNVNVYSNPYEAMGAKYQPLEVQSTTNHSSNIDRIQQRWMEEQRWLDNQMKDIRQRAADGNTIISDDISTVSATNLSNKSLSTLRVRIVRKKNGRIEMSCIGIKKGETWQPCNKSIISLQQMYESAKTDAEKSAILGLMDYGTLLLDTGTNVFVIK